MKEEKIAENIRSEFIKCQNKLQYPINLDQNNYYLGWVYDFNIIIDGKKMFLNLKEENDIF